MLQNRDALALVIGNAVEVPSRHTIHGKHGSGPPIHSRHPAPLQGRTRIRSSRGRRTHGQAGHFPVDHLNRIPDSARYKITAVDTRYRTGKLLSSNGSITDDYNFITRQDLWSQLDVQGVDRKSVV